MLIHGRFPAAERRPVSFAMSDSSTKRTPVQPRGQKVMGLQVQGAACLLIHGRLPAAERRPLSFAKRGRSTKRTPAQPRVSKRSVRARAAHCLFACIGLFAHSRPTPRGGATTGVTYNARQVHEAHARAAARLKTVWVCTCSALPVRVHGAVCTFTADSPRRSDDRCHLQCATGARSARPCSRAPKNDLGAQVQGAACLRA